MGGKSICQCDLDDIEKRENYNFGRSGGISLPFRGANANRNSNVNVNPNRGSVNLGRSSNIGPARSKDNWVFDPKSNQYGRQQSGCVGKFCAQRNIGFSG